MLIQSSILCYHHSFKLYKLGFIFRILLLSSILIDAFLNYTRFISSEFYALFFDICLGIIYLKDIVCDSCSVTFDSL